MPSCKKCPLALICIARGNNDKTMFVYFRCEGCHKTYLNYGSRVRIYEEVGVQLSIPACSRVANGFYTHCNDCISRGRTQT